MADERVGRDTGQGRKNIKRRVLKKRERDSLGLDHAVMIYLGSDGFHLGFWEKGFTRNGIHYPAKPWLRPALEQSQSGIVQDFTRIAGRLIDREVEKLKK